MKFFEEESTGNGGSFLPIVKFDARSGRVKRLDKPIGGAAEEIDITKNFKAVFDLDHVEVGWAKFVAGQAPSWVMAPMRDDVAPPPKPDDDHKKAFRVNLKLAKECGGDVRELGGSSKALIAGFKALHDAYEADRASNVGKLPVVVMDEARPIVTETRLGKNTNYAPVFRITAWVNRPDGLAARPNPAPAPAPRPSAPPSTGSNRLVPGTPPWEAPGTVDEDDFG